MTQYISVAQIRNYVLVIILHHTSKFEITILFHTSLVENIPVINIRLLNISDAKECGEDMCTVTDTSSYIHSLRQHRVKDVGDV